MASSQIPRWANRMENVPNYILHLHSTDARHGEWRFVLETAEGEEVLRAADVEPADRGERVELLAVLRGLESLEGPSRVTVVTPSRYVRRGMRLGLNIWRENGWTWERFGKMVPIKNRDLWQRLDRVSAIHAVEFRAPRTALQPAPESQPSAHPDAPKKRNRIQLRIDPPSDSPLGNGNAVPSPHFLPPKVAVVQASSETAPPPAFIGASPADVQLKFA